MKIPAKYLKELADSRADIASALDVATRAAGDLEKYNIDEAALNERYGKLTSDCDYHDPAGANALQTVQTQLGMVRKRIDAAQTSASPQLDALREKIGGLRNVIPPAVQEEYQALLQDTAKRLLPLYGVWTNALHMAGTMPIMGSFSAFFVGRQYGGWSDSIAEARSVLGILDSMLDGKNPWSFPVQEVGASPDTQTV